MVSPVEAAYDTLRQHIQRLEAQDDISAREVVDSIKKNCTVDWNTLRHQEERNNPTFHRNHWKF